jgi:23S rRNA (adenine2503-C2)-methyltransferase
VETPQGFQRPTRDSVTRFRHELEKAGRVATQRMTRGHAIAAACGQLRRNVEGKGASDLPLRPHPAADTGLIRLAETPV